MKFLVPILMPFMAFADGDPNMPQTPELTWGETWQWLGFPLFLVAVYLLYKYVIKRKK